MRLKPLFFKNKNDGNLYNEIGVESMNYINERILKEAQIILKKGYTIREIANLFEVSKSTVHKDLHERLFDIDKKLYIEVDKILKYHTDIRHIRGGESTKKKYREMKNNL